MRTEKQQEAARINGRKSKGPITEKGKAVSSMNAVTHGLTARTLILNNESLDSYEALKQEYLDYFQPAGEVETGYVAEMVAARWRLRRYWSAETALLDKEMARHDADPDRPVKPLDQPMRCGLAFESLANEGRAFSLLSRYEARLALSQRYALQSFIDLKRELHKGPARA